MTPAAVARLDGLAPQYRSKAEAAWAKVGPLILAADYDARVLFTKHEPLSFNLPGGRYLVDFMHVLDTGQVIFVEVKGSRRMRGYTASRLRLKAAAAVFPFWTFVEAVGGGEDWEIEEVTG